MSRQPRSWFSKIQPGDEVAVQDRLRARFLIYTVRSATRQYITVTTPDGLSFRFDTDTGQYIASDRHVYQLVPVTAEVREANERYQLIQDILSVVTEEKLRGLETKVLRRLAALTEG